MSAEQHQNFIDASNSKSPDSATQNVMDSNSTLTSRPTTTITDPNNATIVKDGDGLEGMGGLISVGNNCKVFVHVSTVVCNCSKVQKGLGSSTATEDTISATEGLVAADSSNSDPAPATSVSSTSSATQTNTDDCVVHRNEKKMEVLESQNPDQFFESPYPEENYGYKGILTLSEFLEEITKCRNPDYHILKLQHQQQKLRDKNNRIADTPKEAKKQIWQIKRRSSSELQFQFSKVKSKLKSKFKPQEDAIYFRTPSLTSTSTVTCASASERHGHVEGQKTAVTQAQEKEINQIDSAKKTDVDAFKFESPTVESHPVVKISKEDQKKAKKKLEEIRKTPVTPIANANARTLKIRREHHKPKHICSNNTQNQKLAQKMKIMKKQERDPKLCYSNFNLSDESKAAPASKSKTAEPRGEEFYKKYFWIFYVEHKKVYQCKICNEKFSYIASLTRKLKDHICEHKNPSCFTCKLCKKTFLNKFSIGRHFDSPTHAKNLKLKRLKTAGSRKGKMTLMKKKQTLK